MISNKYKSQYSRPDWEKIQIKVMRWALEIKLAQNWDKFSKLLQETQNKSIVEYAKDDKIWGAKPTSNDELVGVNALGRLLMELREKYIIQDNRLYCVNPPAVPALLLYNQYVEIVCDDTIIDYQNESMLADNFA